MSWRSRVIVAFMVLLLVFIGGTAGYFLLEGGRTSIIDCAYMTLITISTVGYGEVLPVDSPELKSFTMGLILVGSGSLVYFASAMAAFVIEGELRTILRRRRMERKIGALRGHTIVCGLGRSGLQAARELTAAGRVVVGIDSSLETVERAEESVGKKSFFTLVGDATSDEALREAGLEVASGLVLGLSDDRDNLYVTFTARQISSSIRIVSRCGGSSEGNKILRAGANAVVSPNTIAGHRLVSELVHPQVTGFVDSMLLDQGPLRITEVIIEDGSHLAGRRLGDKEIRRRSNALVVAARQASDAAFSYNPGADLELAPGSLLIVLGPKEAVDTFVKLSRA